MNGIPGSSALMPAPAPESPQVPTTAQNVTKFPDGSVHVADPKQPDELYLNDQENIIDQVSEGELAQMAQQIYKLVEADEISYEPFRAQAEKFIDLFGLVNSDGSLQPLLQSGTTPQIKSSPLIQTFTNLVLSIGKQLLPLDGITDTQICGEVTPFAELRAEVKKDFANDFFDNTIRDFREEMHRVIAWAIVFGYGVKKTYIDPVTLTPTSKFIKNNDFIIHYDHSSSFGAQRKTHCITLTQREFALRCRTGFYKNDAELSQEDDAHNAIDQGLAKTQGVIPDYSEDANKNYVIWETECDYKLKSYKGAEGYDIPLTYILSLDKQTRQPVRLVPNWHKNDPLKKSLSPYTIYSFVPFLAGLGLGIIHLYGAAATCSSDILQLLVRAGEFATEPAGLLNSNVRMTQTELGEMSPGKFRTVMTSGPIRDNFIEINSKEPSPTLKEVKAELDNFILSTSALTPDQISKLSDQAAVTIMALIQEIQKTPNAILQRFYQAFTEELKLFNELFYEWLGGNQSYEFLGAKSVQTVTQEDFIRHPIKLPDGTEIPVLKLVPAADPSMKNSTYRILEAEVVLGHALQQPQLFNMPEVMKFVLGNMGLGEKLVESLMAPPPQPAPPPPAVDPITENQNLLAGKPVKAYPFQDQEAYITVNSLLLNYPDPQIVATTQALIHERHGYILMNQFQQLLQQPMPAEPSQLPPEQQNQLALIAANSVKQGLLTPPVGASQPQEDPKVQVQREKIQNDREMAAGKQEVEKERIHTDYAIEQLKARTTTEKADKEAEEVKLKYSLEQSKLDHQKQIESLESSLKIKIEHERSQREELKSKLEHEKHERENLTEIVNMLREDIKLHTLNIRDKKETEND